MLTVNHLTTVFRNDGKETIAVNDVSFRLFRGETLAIVGESGSGKSVTALSVMGLLPYPQGQVRKGQVIFAGDNGEKDLLNLSERESEEIRGKEISMIFQEPMTSLNPVLTCGFQVAEILVRHKGMKAGDARKKTVDLFREVHLPRAEEMYDSYPHELSGGQKQRVMIAMAIACNPKILIADEPTTALDVTVQKTILELMKEVQKNYGMSIIFITHDLGLVSGFADRVIVMYRGKAVEENTTAEIFTNPRHPYTKGLLNCRPPLNVRLKRLPVIDDFMVPLPGIRKEPERETPAERIERHRVIYSSPPVLSVKEVKTWFPLHYTFFGKPKEYVRAVDDVSFDVYPGETLGIVGESGCGKTTLGRTILNLIRASSGRITFNGRCLSEMKGSELRSLRKDIQIIFQDPYSSLNPRIPVGDAVMEPMEVHHMYGNNDQRRHRVLELFDLVGIDKTSFYRYPHEFSGGQRQRICIARALSMEPNLLICDESVSALDVSVQAQVLNLINDLKKKFGFTCIFISHDLSVVKFMADRIIVMKSGRIEEMAEADELFSNPVSPYTRKLLESVPH